MKIIKKIGMVALILFSSIVIGIGLLSIVYCLPTSKIDENVGESINRLAKEKSYYRLYEEYAITQVDNYTEGTMLGTSLFPANKYNWLERSLSGYRYIYDDKYPLESLISHYNANEKQETMSLAKYWHGYLIYLKPLLTVINYDDVLILNSVVMTFLVIAVAFLMSKTSIKKYILPFLISILLIYPAAITRSLQLSTPIYVMLVSIIILLVINLKFPKFKSHEYLFLINGISICFFDLLSYPLITLGMPLIFLILLTKRDIKETIFIIIKATIFWFIGYIGMWVSKWIITDLILGTNVIKEAIDKAILRTGIHGEFTYLDAVIKNIKVFNIPAFKLIMLISFIYAIIMFIKNKVWKNIKYYFSRIWPFLVIAMMPFCWMFVSVNHSFIHAFFVSRSLLITFFCIFIIIVEISTKKE